MTFLLGIIISTRLVYVALGQSGGGDDDMPNRGCVALNGPSTMGTNSTLADSVKRAECYSLCLEQLNLGRDKLANMQLPHIRMDELTSNCQLYMQVEECVRGCVYRKDNQTEKQCNISCQSGCSQSQTPCNSHNNCDQKHCFYGCSLINTGNGSIVQMAPIMPFIPPKLRLIAATSSNSTYALNISMTDLQQLDSNSTVTGSGDLQVEPLAFIYKVTELDSRVVYYIEQPGLSDVFIFYKSICEKVQIQYALVNKHGISGFSPPFELFVKGDEVNPPEAVDLSSVRIDQVYDYRPGLFGHARLNITWENPPNITQISHFNLSMIGVNCGSAFYPWIKPSLDIRTTHLITASTPEDPPFLGCRYTITITSVSLSSDYPPASTKWLHECPASLFKTPNIMLECTRQLINNKFKLTAKLTIPQYLANERVIKNFDIIPYIVTYSDSTKTSVMNRETLLLQTIHLNSNDSVIIHTLNEDVIPESEPLYNAQLVATSGQWVDTLKYTPTAITSSCLVDIQALQPSQVNDVLLSSRVERSAPTQFMVSVQWSPPTESNGLLKNYDTCVGTAPLEPTADIPSASCTLPANCYHCIPNISPHTTSEDISVFFPPHVINCLFVQVRSQNTYRPSNWTEGIIIPLTEDCIVRPLKPVNFSNVNIQSSYDDRSGYFGHARLNISWQHTSNIEVNHFNLIITGGQGCGTANYTHIEPTNGTNFHFITATTPVDLPFLGCTYTMKLQSVAVSYAHLPALLTWTYAPDANLYKPKNITISCQRHFSNDTFTIISSFKLSDYIIKENVIDVIHIEPMLVAYTDVSKMHQVTMERMTDIQLEDIPVQENQSVINFTINNVLPRSEAVYDYLIKVESIWKSLVFVPMTLMSSCLVDAQAPSPPPVTDYWLASKPQRTGDTQFMLNLQWSRPSSVSIEETLTYEVCFGTDALEPEASLPATSCTSQTNCHTCTKTSDSSLAWDVSFYPYPGSDCLYLQVRSSSPYRAANWTEAVVIAITSFCDLANESVLPDEPNESLTPEPSDGEHQKIIIISCGVGVLALILAILITLLILYAHWKLRQRKRQLEFIREINDDSVFRMGPKVTNPLFDQSAPLLDDWEIPASHVVIDESLGEGAFGEVYRGVITDLVNNSRMRALLKQNNSGFVAVKLLKTSATGSERTDFLSEIELMKKIAMGNNPHVVNMVGCVTIQEPLSLITEFVKHGDLLSYLRTSRKSRKIDEESGENANPYSDLGELMSVDLLSFAYQIASGMEFLSSLGIIHRDLAARNVLVGEGKSLKISDFGMARVIGTGADDVYVKTTRGRLPLKWMAIESIIDREFTSASDVWAYGVTLWEIGTLGGFPYPSVPNQDLLLQLRQGYRMEQPENCSPEIYDIMLECWHEYPRKRPTFTELRSKFDSLLAAQQCNAYIDLRTDEHKDYYNMALLEEEHEEDKKEEEEEETDSMKCLDDKMDSDEEEDEDFDERTSLHTPERRRKSPSPSFRMSYLQATPSPQLKKKRTPSPSRLSLEMRVASDDSGYTTLTPARPSLRSPRLSPRPVHPTSIAFLNERENEYVDEPCGAVTINIVPSTPQYEATDRLLQVPTIDKK